MNSCCLRPESATYATCVRRRRAVRLYAHSNYYTILDVPTDATQEEIKAAFRRKAKVLHPDVNKASDADEAFRALARAYESLSNSMLRMQHDSELDLPQAAAADPRFKRFYRWRREVVPDLEGQLEVWTAEIHLILSTAEQALWAQEQDCMQLVRGDDRDQCSPQGAAQAVVSSMQGLLQDAVANVQRLYDKRYEQVQVRYPAYPDIVWYDVWLEASDGWLAASAKLDREWKRRIESAVAAAAGAGQ